VQEDQQRSPSASAWDDRDLRQALVEHGALEVVVNDPRAVGVRIAAPHVVAHGVARDGERHDD
jgi:hypothetical protein